MAHFLLWLSSLFLIFQLASSNLIEIPASKKECFFEDLHVNDQVRVTALPRISNLTHLLFVPDDCYVPGWRRRSLGHRFLGERRPLLAIPTPLTQVTDQRSHGQRN